MHYLPVQLCVSLVGGPCSVLRRWYCRFFLTRQQIRRLIWARMRRDALLAAILGQRAKIESMAASMRDGGVVDLYPAVLADMLEHAALCMEIDDLELARTATPRQ